MLKTIGFIMFFEVDKGPRDRDANRDDVARKSRGCRREVARRSQGGREEGARHVRLSILTPWEHPISKNFTEYHGRSAHGS